MLQPLSTPKNLIPLYLAAGAILVMMVGTSHLMAMRALRGGDEAALAINVSGLQRSLTQRIAHLTLLEQLAGTEPGISEKLDRTIERYREGHRALYSGGALGLSKAGAAERRPIVQLKRDGQTLDDRFRMFLRQVEQARSGDPGAMAVVADLENTDALIAHLNTAVRRMQQQASARVSRAKKVSLASTVAALLVLLGEALFIFIPAQRAINHSFSKLTKRTEQLKASKRELQTALGDADMARSFVEELLEKRRRMAAELASDVSRPLLSLDASLRILRTNEGDAEQARELGEARRAADSIRKCIQAALGADSTLTGSGLLDEGPVDLRTFVDSVTVIATVWAHQKNLECTCDVEHSLPETLLLDCPRMERVLINLLNNAVKYTAKGQIHLRVSAAGRGLVRFAVTDTGQGIPEDQIASLFRSYRGVEGRDAHAASGTGLGLAVCREFTELMGGTIRVESTLGEGTTFTVTIPLKEPERMPSIPTPGAIAV